MREGSKACSSSAAIPLPNVEECPLPRRVLTDHAAEVAPGPAAAEGLLCGPPPLPWSASPHPFALPSANPAQKPRQGSRTVEGPSHCCRVEGNGMEQLGWKHGAAPAVCPSSAVAK